MTSVRGKLGAMRTEREWTVLRTSDGSIIVQTIGAIGIFDPVSGHGRFTTRGGYFPHLAIARPYQFPAAFVDACVDALVSDEESNSAKAKERNSQGTA